MKILAIETSCDDTGIAIIEIRNSKFEILSNVVSSQTIHANYGGVFPVMAKREHQRNLVPVLEQALKLAKLQISKSQFPNPKQIPISKIKILKKILEKEGGLFESVKEFLETYQKPDIDYIAVTNGPGLEPCLWVGVNFAKALSYFWNIPVIPVNHIEGHILINFLPKASEITNFQLPIAKTIFPAISLIVSGGHTQLILVKGIGKYQIIGETLDDAVGECFDKSARILNLGYPGGPAIAKIASQRKFEIRNHLRGGLESPAKFEISLPRPMMHSKDYNFSFSGLKTAVLYKVRDTKPEIVKSQEFIQEMCFAVQEAICDVLIKKTLKAVKDYKVKTIILGGGVSANSALRTEFEFKIQNLKLKILYPEKNLSTDNGLMIAVAGYFNLTQSLPKIGRGGAKKIAQPLHKASAGRAWQKLSVNANLRV